MFAFAPSFDDLLPGRRSCNDQPSFDLHPYMMVSRMPVILEGRTLHAQLRRVGRSLTTGCVRGMVLCTLAHGSGEAVAQSANPQIARIVAAISAERIEATIGKLVEFGTRHTL